uniref:TPT domain-containing protein n=2 Tax=Macrostomum lignano TaxID=282301 RepID=A0A1I8GSI6_9PLAT
INELQPTAMPSEKSHPPIKIVGVILTYWTVSISMVFANKYLVGDKLSNKLDVSLFVAWAQCVSTVLVVVALVAFRRLVLGHDIELPPLSREILMNRDFLLLSCMFTGMLTFNNLCLKYVGVAFFQVARSMTLIFTVIFSSILLRRVSSLPVWLCCLIVAAGFVLGVDQEKVAGTLSTVGIMYGVSTSLFVSLNGIFTKRLLDMISKNQALAVTYYMNIGGSILFMPLLICFGQFSAAYSSRGTDFSFLLLLASSGVLSFLIGWASNMQIDYTSPVTHHISNNTKAVLQTLLAVFVYSEHKSAIWWLSNCLVVAGAFSYTMVKMREERLRREAEAAAAAAAAGANGKSDQLNI